MEAAPQRESEINSKPKLHLFAELAVVMLRRDFVTFQLDETLLTATARTAVNLHPPPVELYGLAVSRKRKKRVEYD